MVFVKVCLLHTPNSYRPSTKLNFATCNSIGCPRNAISFVYKNPYIKYPFGNTFGFPPGSFVQELFAFTLQ